MKPYDLHVKLDLDLDQLVNMIKLIIENFFLLKTTIYKSDFRNVKNFLSNPAHFLILYVKNSKNTSYGYWLVLNLDYIFPIRYYVILL